MRAQEHAELPPRLLQQRLALGERLGEPLARGRENSREFLEEPLAARLGVAARGLDLRRVDLELVEILAQLHRLVEERAHGEVEEHHARQVVAHVTGPEQRVAALLQAEQHARLAVASERLHLLEAQTAAALALEETPQQPMREQELANDVDQANRGGLHRRSIPSRGPCPYTAPAHDPGVPMHQLDFWSMIFVFMLATFIGIDVIRSVSRLLHTPLMSLTNAISAIAVVGAIIVAGEQKTDFQPRARRDRGRRVDDQHRQRLPDHRPDAQDVQDAARAASR